MPRAAAMLLLCSLWAYAPFQCTGEPDPTKALEETPGEALYELAAQFRASGDHEAWAATLRYLIDNYPSSRFAHMAKLDLEKAGASAASGGQAEGGGR